MGRQHRHGGQTSGQVAALVSGESVKKASFRSMTSVLVTGYSLSVRLVASSAGPHSNPVTFLTLR